jgi:pimeloyl-ACP methyl ester carboxylesterase
MPSLAGNIARFCLEGLVGPWRPTIFVTLTLILVGAVEFSGNNTLRDQSSRTEADERLVDVGGRRLLISCKGDRSPTVIVERGLAGNDTGTPPTGITPSFSGPWGGVQSKIAEFARVCLYSRANVGRSDPDPAPVRTGRNVVDDLHALLQNAKVLPPYVLVGHSLGGIYVRIYASRFPADVVGMVLVESSHEDQVDRLIAAGSSKEDEALPAPTENRERTDLRVTLDELRAMNWRATIPLVVIVRGTTMRQAYRRLSDERVRQIDSAWLDLQRDLAGRSMKGRLVIAPKSGHNIQADQPELVIDAIRAVVEQIRMQ